MGEPVGHSRKKKPNRRRSEYARIALSDAERAEAHAARAVLVGSRGGLRELLLGLIRGNVHEMADERRIADLAGALAAARAVTGDVRDLTWSLRELEQRVARLALDFPDQTRDLAGDLREVLRDAERAVDRVERTVAVVEKAAAPAFESISSAVRGILEAHGIALKGGPR